jgi:hypothetical protein
MLVITIEVCTNIQTNSAATSAYLRLADHQVRLCLVGNAQHILQEAVHTDAIGWVLAW